MRFTLLTNKVVSSAIVVLGLVASACSSRDYKPHDPIEPTPPQEGWQLGLVMLGDTGTGEADQYAVAKGIEAYCSVELCDDGLLLGDNIYSWGVKSSSDPQFKSKFEEPYKNLPFQFKVVLGNHDAYGSWESQIEYRSERWLMPDRWYKWRKYGVDLFGLDTNWTPFQRKDKGRPQRDWLDKSLAGSAGPWRIVYGHHPVYSGGNHGDTRRLKKYLAPMLRKHKVDFYVSGHDHHLELLQRDGVVYVISGAGAKLRSHDREKETVWGKATFGFAHLLLNERTARLRFVDKSGRVMYEKLYRK